MEVIKLDIGCGMNKQEGFIGMDCRELPGVDIVHDLEEFPWPVEDNCVMVAVASHVVEHIKPWFSIPFMDEVWRVLAPGAVFAVATPYPGSRGFWQDPTHCNGWNEATWQYFDPRYPLYFIYKPKPWRINKGFPIWQANGNMEVLLEKVVDAEKLIDEAKREAEEEAGKAGETLGISVAETVKSKEAIG